MAKRFRDRAHAGRVLAERLVDLAGRDDVVVLGLPRGGVPVAAEVARALDAPLGAFAVRKLGVPGHQELAMGAIASGGVVVVNEDVVASHGIRLEALQRVAELERAELERREAAYLGGSTAHELEGKTVVLVDDGLATGSTMKAAVRAVRAAGPKVVIVAVPVGSAATCRELQDEADRVICAESPVRFQAVGAWYEDFSQTTDAEVKALLE